MVRGTTIISGGSATPTGAADAGRYSPPPGTSPPARSSPIRNPYRKSARCALGELRVFPGADDAGIVRPGPVERRGQIGPLLHRGVGVKLEDVPVRVGGVETPGDDGGHRAQ